MKRLLYRLTAGRPCRLIPLPSGPYLERYYMGQLFGVTFYLHRFVRSDSERHLHNHPWRWGRALVLRGGYVEERVADLTCATSRGVLVDCRAVRFWNRVNGADFHRIANTEPETWTLFFHGPRQYVGLGMASRPKGWGFLESRTVLEVRGAEYRETVFRPYPAGRNLEWWKEAPKGRDADREPLAP